MGKKHQIASEQEVSDALMRLEKAVEEDKRKAYEIIHGKQVVTWELSSSSSEPC